ncbi:MAG: T9SS type A sorting domain-containing protein [Bacteroidota bacterium]|jgi:hypothetical protein|nr:T9SS type A sorting domain-containing protein [Bacteroidota bacterium]
MTARFRTIARVTRTTLMCSLLSVIFFPEPSGAQSSMNYSIAFDVIDNAGASSTTASAGYQLRSFVGQAAVHTAALGAINTVASGAGCAFCESNFVIGVEAVALAAVMRLSQNYPNPFNPTTTIGYVLEREATVQLAVYNLLGDRIALIVNERQEPGEYHIDYDASPLPGGVYLYRLRTEHGQLMRRFVLLK